MWIAGGGQLLIVGFAVAAWREAGWPPDFVSGGMAALLLAGPAALVADLAASLIAARASTTLAVVGGVVTAGLMTLPMVGLVVVEPLLWGALLLALLCLWRFRDVPLPVPWLPRSRFLRQVIRGSSDLDPYRSQVGVQRDPKLGQAYLPQFGRWREDETGGIKAERDIPVYRLAGEESSVESEGEGSVSIDGVDSAEPRSDGGQSRSISWPN